MPGRCPPTRFPVFAWGAWPAISVGGYALIVDAKGPAAEAFYERHGFRRFQDTPRSLYLPLGG